MYGQLMAGGMQFVHCRELHLSLIGVSIIGGFTVYIYYPLRIQRYHFGAVECKYCVMLVMIQLSEYGDRHQRQVQAAVAGKDRLPYGPSNTM